jgi:hypothetical protein
LKEKNKENLGQKLDFEAVFGVLHKAKKFRIFPDFT